MEIATKDLIPATTLKDILRVNIAEEEAAIKMYRSMLDSVGHDGTILYETIEDILKDKTGTQRRITALTRITSILFFVSSLDRESEAAPPVFSIIDSCWAAARHNNKRAEPESR